jgi:hypothetical protein
MFKRKILILLSLTVLLAIVNAAVFTYYPTNLSLSPVKPPIVFSNGKNAGQPDLSGTNTIGVTIGSANTSLTITLHPTYQYNYYKNITIIKNQDTKAYYIAIRVNTPLSNAKLLNATLHIYDITGTTIKNVDLKATGTTAWLGPLNSGSKWFIDIILRISETTGDSPSTAPFASDSASLQLIYSPQSAEQAPTVP